MVQKKIFRFNLPYLIIALFLFLTEIFIALFFKGHFIRIIFGDFLVVILIYTFLRSILNVSIIKTALITLLFAYSIEFLQYLNILNLLGLKKSTGTDIILGSTFDWNDIMAYTLGIVSVLIIEFIYYYRKLNRSIN